MIIAPTLDALPVPLVVRPQKYSVNQQLIETVLTQVQPREIAISFAELTFPETQRP
jgi:hypothetical protein